jgi:hypothetical protein
MAHLMETELIQTCQIPRYCVTFLIFWDSVPRPLFHGQTLKIIFVSRWKRKENKEAVGIVRRLIMYFHLAEKFPAIYRGVFGILNGSDYGVLH